jgi:hypothetical protein
LLSGKLSIEIVITWSAIFQGVFISPN